MQLIVDSGSTKADWVLSSKGEVLERIKTKGLNPAVISKDEISAVLHNESKFIELKDKIEDVYFYGAGCGTEKPRLALKTTLQHFFKKANVNVYEDTLAAVYACISKPNQKAIVCILGTGSNCSYYNGQEIEQRVTSLGYTLMDDASGNYFGKQLLRDYYFNKMPNHIKTAFEAVYDLSADTIKYKLYKQPFPNAYLAQFAKIMIDFKNDAYILELIRTGLKLFIENMLMAYESELKNIPVHFVGSIGYFCKEELELLSQSYHFSLGQVIKSPIDGLVSFHQKN